MSNAKRKCTRCGEDTEETYSAEEWVARGEICEQCEEEELIVLDII